MNFFLLSLISATAAMTQVPRPVSSLRSSPPSTAPTLSIAASGSFAARKIQQVDSNFMAALALRTSPVHRALSAAGQLPYFDYAALAKNADLPKFPIHFYLLLKAKAKQMSVDAGNKARILDLLVSKMTSFNAVFRENEERKYLYGFASLIQSYATVLENSREWQTRFVQAIAGATFASPYLALDLVRPDLLSVISFWRSEAELLEAAVAARNQTYTHALNCTTSGSLNEAKNSLGEVLLEWKKICYNDFAVFQQTADPILAILKNVSPELLQLPDSQAIPAVQTWTTDIALLETNITASKTKLQSLVPQFQQALEALSFLIYQTSDEYAEDQLALNTNILEIKLEVNNLFLRIKQNITDNAHVTMESMTEYWQQRMVSQHWSQVMSTSQVAILATRNGPRDSVESAKSYQESLIRDVVKTATYQVLDFWGNCVVAQRQRITTVKANLANQLQEFLKVFDGSPKLLHYFTSDINAIVSEKLNEQVVYDQLNANWIQVFFSSITSQLPEPGTPLQNLIIGHTTPKDPTVSKSTSGESNEEEDGEENEGRQTNSTTATTSTNTTTSVSTSSSNSTAQVTPAVDTSSSSSAASTTPPNQNAPTDPASQTDPNPQTDSSAQTGSSAQTDSEGGDRMLSEQTADDDDDDSSSSDSTGNLAALTALTHDVNKQMEVHLVQVFASVLAEVDKFAQVVVDARGRFAAAEARVEAQLDSLTWAAASSQILEAVAASVDVVDEQLKSRMVFIEAKKVQQAELSQLAATQSAAATLAATNPAQELLQTLSTALRYIPEQLGVKYTNTLDELVSMAGQLALAGGAMNRSARARDFEHVRQLLAENFERRQTYVAELGTSVAKLEDSDAKLQTCIGSLNEGRDRIIRMIDSGITGKWMA